MKIRYDSCQVASPCVALTFDDGPHPEQSAKLLDILKERGVRTTLFMVGQACEKHPELLRRAFVEGHEIGNHTWTHPSLTKLGTPEVLDELDRTSAIIGAVTGRNPALMRPPYIDTNAALDQLIAEHCGMKVIGATVDSRDWSGHGAERTADYIYKGIKAGAIVLCHENQPNTIKAMGEILDTLLAREFEFVTVSELIAREEAGTSKEAQ